jgi:hypothetical protein
MQEFVEPDYLHCGVLFLEPGDLVVIKVSRPIPDYVYHRIMQQAQAKFPDNQIVLLEEGMDIGIIKQGGSDGEST